jgi:UDPglucose--hexose-1-phosphate uridylyltransferase
MSFNFSEHPHRRYNPLTGDWLQVSPHRANRPWQGQEEETPEEKRPQYDPDCYLCPGNSRAGDAENPEYESTFVFTNDFSALKLDTPTADYNKEDLLIARGEQGICRVICFSPRHDLTLPLMDVGQIRDVVDLWTDEYRSLGEKENINFVQIFENKGEMMGCSNPHPHGQIWAEQTIPDEPSKELKKQREYQNSHGNCLLCDYHELEQREDRRKVIENDHFIVYVPFWATWPFEILLMSKRHYQSFLDMSDEEKDALADIIRRMTIRFDNLFQVSFPYSAGFHPEPTDGNDHPYWHFHMHFYPPLLRSATIKKFMVGYEMLGNPQRDITPEWSAGKLRELSEVHYNNS